MNKNFNQNCHYSHTLLLWTRVSCLRVFRRRCIPEVVVEAEEAEVAVVACHVEIENSQDRPLKLLVDRTKVRTINNKVSVSSCYILCVDIFLLFKMYMKIIFPSTKNIDKSGRTIRSVYVTKLFCPFRKCGYRERCHRVYCSS